MATALSRFQPQTRPSSPFTSLDAKAIACRSDWSRVYTSPNMTFIPEPHNDEEELHARADGCFGTADCFQWPQLYCKEYEYTVCIPRREFHAHPDPLAWAWYTPTLEDFDILPNATFSVGQLQQEKAVGVATLSHIASMRYAEWKKKRGEKKDIITRMLQSLQHTVTVLLQHPLVFHDVVVFVTQAQRTFLDIYAFLDYVEIVLPRISYPITPHLVKLSWMGCFTQDTAVCDELFRAGVPVWLNRPTCTITNQTIIERPVKFSFPDHIMRGMYSEHGRSVRPFDLLYRGGGGLSRHIHSCRYYVGITNTSSASLPTSSSPSNVGKAPTYTQARKAEQKRHSYQRKASSGGKSHAKSHPSGESGGRNKWEELLSPEMPTPFLVWQNAIKRVEKDSTPVNLGVVDWGYRVPEPALLISSQSPERRQLYLTNWLAVRPYWITRLAHSPPSQYPSPQLWREFLNSLPPKCKLETTHSSARSTKTAAKSRKLAAYEIFGEEAAHVSQGSHWAPMDVVDWRGREIPIESLKNPLSRLVRAVLWELYEIGFRYELLALDQALVPRLWAEHSRERVSLFSCVFPSMSGLMMWSEPLPKELGSLGLTDSYFNNEKVLQSFCLLLAAWPDTPSSLYAFATATSLCEDRKDTAAYDGMSCACYFYIQTFFNHFGRPPLLPHAFPFEYHE